MAQPIVVDPSQGWDGDDGPWSSFFIRVGSPAQALRVLVSTTVPETWVALKSGCTDQDPSGCNVARGSLFNPNASTTWQDQGLYALGVEMNLPYTGNSDNGDYGFDTLGLGVQGNGVTVSHSVVAGIATKDFFLGNLGLTPRPINFTEFDNPRPSLLTKLRDSNQIPSLTYGYSAGAKYRLKQVDATLTLGGYDQSRFAPNNVSFNFASDISRDLVVGLQSIQFTDQKSTKNLLPGNGILTFIDSTVPHIWLPLEACHAFEQAFSITYDNATDLYLVSDSQHNALKSQNASVSFLLGNDVQGGQTVNITLPYASFDLQLTQYYPGINQTTQYFPLRRAANDSQYTLGRAFLQEAYITVDYERHTFNVAQALFRNNVPQQIIPIPSINTTGPGNVTKVPQTPPPTRKLGAGATAGIIIAALALCALIIGALTFWYRRRRKSRELPDETSSEKAEMDNSGSPIVGELYAPKKSGLEMEGSDPNLAKDEKSGRPKLEMQGSQGGVEMEGSRPPLEMQGSHGGAEMEGSHGAAEMLAQPHEVYELPADDGLRELSAEREPRQAQSRKGSGNRRGRQSGRWSFARGGG